MQQSRSSGLGPGGRRLVLGGAFAIGLVLALGPHTDTALAAPHEPLLVVQAEAPQSPTASPKAPSDVVQPNAAQSATPPAIPSVPPVPGVTPPAPAEPDASADADDDEDAATTSKGRGEKRNEEYEQYRSEHET
jgi:hypothetical protein